jgi:hypothetical protein
LVVFVGGIFAGVYYLAPGEGIALDSQFGDQHLKTAVALIELHPQKPTPELLRPDEDATRGFAETP